jgi:2-amino-4-deoxychorismate synthase
MSKFALDPLVQACLKERNAHIAGFWLSAPEERTQLDPALVGRKAVVVDAEDAFTAMLTQQLAAIGLDVTRCRFDEPTLFERRWDLTVMGPGPGDPSNMQDVRIASIQRVLTHLLSQRMVFLAVCLSHQILCRVLGLELIKRASPNQGVQREINLFGTRERVGFYNTFVARCDQGLFHSLDNMPVEVSRDSETSEVHALRGAAFSSFQFHAESLLTQRGVNIISTHVKRLLAS